MNNLKIIENEVNKVLKQDNTGHNVDHIYRVVNIANSISKKEEANIELVQAIAFLHDVDDYKIVGINNSDNLSNAIRILNMTTYSEDEKNIILESIKTIGYSKRLDGILPNTIEAKIVSDADMLDAIGAIGIIRTLQYNLSNNKKIFDKYIFPNVELDSKTYKSNKDGTAINHLFEKILKLKDFMLTEEGKKEALKRHNFVISFLDEYFYEENALEWKKILEEYGNK